VLDREDKMNGYIALYKNKRIELEAETAYAAQQKAAEIFKTKKGWEIAIVLAEVNGETVTHDPSEYSN
jgi:hypothetical protein